MPTYSYRCTVCADEFDVRQSFDDTPLTTCEQCGGKLRKLFGSVGVVFKGSGFYHTDSKSKANLGAKKQEGEDSSSSASAASPKREASKS